MSRVSVYDKGDRRYLLSSKKWTMHFHVSRKEICSFTAFKRVFHLFWCPDDAITTRPVCPNLYGNIFLKHLRKGGGWGFAVINKKTIPSKILTWR